ncbi:hypothetical protein IQ274_31560 [Nostoc sp. LEGE 12447]|uniref:hypothetical protein n=1 Tax=Nostoc sp. LEGE 12447 TaxID=1828640 RepID=UPI0018847241|nr:hypothetical protein [Nostoc sp. LEGE 12447]MBE9002601.1 hypothetical protein [Nostoc sp. LEGE 12447]
MNNFNFDKLIGKTIEEAKELIKGLNYELRVHPVDVWTGLRATTQNANKAIIVILKDGKIAAYKVI